MGEISHDSQVVTDKKHRDMCLGLKTSQQGDDVGLYRDIERRQDFVAQQKLGVGDQRACNRNTLTLATGEFVRVARRA